MKTKGKPKNGKPSKGRKCPHCGKPYKGKTCPKCGY